MEQINYRGIVATQDMAQALRALNAKAGENGWRLELVKKVLRQPMADAGREVQFRLHHSGKTNQQGLEAAWGFAVPLGFTPWARWPVGGSEADWVFHFLGPWQTVADNLLAEGRGQMAWPSVEAAALADVGKGLRCTEKFVQAQLHRIGKNPGPVDGIIGPRTTGQLETLALDRSSLTQVAEQLKGMESFKARTGKAKAGHIFVHGRQTVVQAVGAIQVQQHPHGALLAVRGPGRVLVDIGETT